MPKSTYAYRVRDSGGSVMTGSIVANSADEVGTRLRAEGNVVLSVHENAMQAEQEIDTRQIARTEVAKRIKRDDVISFSQQLAVMLETGVPLTEALDSFAVQTPRPEFRQILQAVRDDIHSGEPFSVALSRWPKVFPSMMVSLMRASEASGTMSHMLSRIGDYLSKERRTIKQIRGALSYPIFMITIGLGMTIFLLAFVLPRFANIYEQREASLPAPTQVLMAISEFFTTQYLYYGPSLLIVTIIVFFWVRRPSGRRAVDWIRLNTPVLRTLYGQVYLTRMARTMATLVNAGINLLDIISICRGVTNNWYYERFWDKLSAEIRDGRQLSDVYINSSLIPPNIASMVAAGERAGRLGEVFERIAEFTDEELDNAVKQVTSIIEPLMITVMGVVIGGVAMALLLPIFSMGNVVSGG